MTSSLFVYNRVHPHLTLLERWFWAPTRVIKRKRQEFAKRRCSPHQQTAARVKSTLAEVRIRISAPEEAKEELSLSFPVPATGKWKLEHVVSCMNFMMAFRKIPGWITSGQIWFLVKHQMDLGQAAMAKSWFRFQRNMHAGKMYRLPGLHCYMTNTECADVQDGKRWVMIFAFFCTSRKRFMLN